MAAGPPSLLGEEDGFSESGGVHDGLDLGRSIIQRANVRDRVRQPDPGLIEHEDATERGELVEEGLEFGHGEEQLDVGDDRRDADKLDGPVAEHLIRQAEIAALGVRRFRHGLSVVLLALRLPTLAKLRARQSQPRTPPMRPFLDPTTCRGIAALA